MSDYTLKQAITVFLHGHIETTKYSYGRVLHEFADSLDPAISVQDIRAEHLIEYVQAVRERPSIQSDATVNKYVKTLRTFFNWCVKADILERSPAKTLKTIRRPKLIDRQKAMPEDAYERLLDYAKWTPRYHALVLFLGDTGCRIGGAAGLRWSEVDLDANSAFVTEKGQPARPVFFGEMCREALKRWRSQQTLRDGQYVFQRHGRRLTNNALGQLFERICQRAGIGQWGPHSLRHRKGHNLADQGTAPTVAAKLMGHADPSMTLDFYYPRDWERVRQAASKLHQRSTTQPDNIIQFPRAAGNE